jgi:hypothetical protein
MTRCALHGVLAFALAAALSLGACSRSDPERELRDTIARMAAAVEARKPADLLDRVADDFSRESGAFGKQDIKRVLAGVLLRNEKITVSAIVTETKVDGPRATARVRVIAGGGSGVLPERGQTWDFTTHWRRDGKAWVVFNAEWQDGR